MQRPPVHDEHVSYRPGGGVGARHRPRPAARDPRRRAPAASGVSRGTAAPMAASSGAALAAASRASAAPSESATTPPPTPSQMRSPAISNVRMATLSSSPATGLARPMAPV